MLAASRLMSQSSNQELLRKLTPFLRGGIASLRTSIPTRSGPKTEIQKWGWEYLMKQKSLKRPLSPHLSVYAPQWTWYVSGLHRISGAYMTGAIILLCGGLVVTQGDFTALVEWIRSWNLPRPIVFAVKWLIAFSLTFHTANGIRFLGFDMTKGIDIKSVYLSGYFVTAFAIIIGILVASMKLEKSEVYGKK